MKKLLLMCLFGLSQIVNVYAQSVKTETEYQLGIDAIIDKGGELESYERSVLGLNSEAYIKAHPNSAYAYLYRGKALKKLGMDGDALEALNKSLSINPKQLDANAHKVDLLYNVATYYANNKEKIEGTQKIQMVNMINDAIETSSQAVKYSRNNSDSCLYQYKKGYMLNLIDQPALAIESLTKLSAFADAKNSYGKKYKCLSLSKLADIKYNQKEYNASIDFAKKAIETDPNMYDPYTTLSLIYYWVQENDNLALPYLTKGFELDTEGNWSTGFFQGLSEILSSRKEFDQLLRYSLIMQRRDPNYDMGFLHAGDIYLRRGNQNDGIEMFKKAARLGNDHAKQTLRSNGISW